MPLDHGSRGGLRIAFGKGAARSSAAVSDEEFKLTMLLMGAVALVSAGLSNVTRHTFDADVMGTYTRNDSRLDNGGMTLAFSYRAVARTPEGAQVVLRNEPDLFAGKFYVMPTLMQNEMSESIGQRCTFEANGWNLYPFRKNILDVRECRPIPAPLAAGGG